ncbi:hypothetical protein TNCV_2236111 [Trichonephila clavipes]|nr:hypothetical protein TNCV_2236111 [Trichonephila clavipes]
MEAGKYMISNAKSSQHLEAFRIKRVLGKTLRGSREHITRIQMCTATHGQKRFHLVVGSIVLKIIGGNRPE